MAKRKTRNPDHVRRKNVPGPDNEIIKSQLTDLVSSAIASQLAYYQQLGLRSRILNLPYSSQILFTQGEVVMQFMPGNDPG